MDQDYLDNLKQFFETGIPFHRTLGLKVLEVRAGHCLLELPAKAEHVGDISRPALHGGVISTLADTAGGLTVFSGAQPGDRVSTIDLRVDFLRPGRTDAPIRARGTLIRIGNRVGMAEMLVFHEGWEHKPVAKAAGVFNVVRAGG